MVSLSPHQNLSTYESSDLMASHQYIYSDFAEFDDQLNTDSIISGHQSPNKGNESPSMDKEDPLPEDLKHCYSIFPPRAVSDQGNVSLNIYNNDYTSNYRVASEFQKSSSSYLPSNQSFADSKQNTILLTSVTCPSQGFFEYFNNYIYPNTQSLKCLSSIDFFTSSSIDSKAPTSLDNLIIFDWDDTILPSTWLASSKHNPRALQNFIREDEDALSEIADIVAKTLGMACEYGEVVIITNAEQGWIELSCERFFPSLINTVSKIKIISARSAYAGEPTFNPSLWKQQSFINVIKDFYNSRCTNTTANIISIGDSMHERSALINSQNELNSMELRPKSLKLIEQPHIDDLKKEHEVIQSFFGDLIRFEGVLDLILFDLSNPHLCHPESEEPSSTNVNSNSFNILPQDCPSNPPQAPVNSSTDFLISVENYS